MNAVHIEYIFCVHKKLRWQFAKMCIIKVHVGYCIPQCKALNLTFYVDSDKSVIYIYFDSLFDKAAKSIDIFTQIWIKNNILN